MVVTTTVRVERATRDRAAALASATGRPMIEILDAAVRVYEDQVFWERAQRYYADQRADSGAQRGDEAERAEYDGALADGLEG